MSAADCCTLAPWRGVAGRLIFLRFTVIAPLPFLISEAQHPLQVKAWREMGGNGRLALAVELGQRVCS